MNQLNGNSAVAGLHSTAPSTAGALAHAGVALDRGSSTNAFIADQNHQQLIALVRKFIESTWDLNVTSYTLRVYQSRARQFLNFLLATKTSSDFDGGLQGAFAGAFQAFLRHLRLSGLRSSSVNNYIRFARMFGKHYGWDSSAIPKMQRLGESSCNLSKSDFETYLACLTMKGSLRDQSLVALLVACPLTIDEILLLRSSEVLVADRSVEIRRNGAAPLHSSVLTEQSLESLAAWIDKCSGDLASDRPGLLFPGKGVRALSRTAADAIVRKFGWKCGLVVSIRELRKVLSLE